MDLVYIVRNGDENEDLKYSLRSIEKNAPKFNNIFIVGYKPDWVSDNVIYIPTHQRKANSKHLNTNTNVLTACKDSRISEDFILMNDDFILIKKITNWNKSLSKVKNTISEQIKIYSEDSPANSLYKKTFSDCLNLIQEISGNKNPLNWELHIPIIINKKNYINLFSDERVLKYIDEHTIILKRSLYGNCFNKHIDIIDDVKLRYCDLGSINNEWLSVFDGCIGNNRKYPKLNSFLYKAFNEKSIYER